MYHLLDFSTCKCENEKFDLAYKIFKQDFIEVLLYLAGCIYIDPQSYKKHKGKEKIFWHITTRENKQNKTREFDSQRACRINWIKQIIINHTHPEIKAFYYKEKRAIRFYLWLHNHNFIVILQKLGRSSSFLVTSFYIDKGYNKNIYEKRYRNYINGNDIELKNCEWF